MSVVQDDTISLDAAKKLAAFRQLTSEIHETNKTEPLPPEFDAIINERVNFARELDLLDANIVS